MIATTNSMSKIKNMMLMFDMKELLYFIAWTFSGTKNEEVRSMLKPLRYFHPRRGLK